MQWVWRMSNAMASPVAPHYFGPERTLLLPPTTSVLPRQGNTVNVLCVVRPPLLVRKWKTHSKPNITEEHPPQSKTTPGGEYDINHIPSRISQRSCPRPAIRQIDNVITTADKSDSETLIFVSPSTAESLDVGGSAASRRTVWADSSIRELTTTSICAAPASNVDETSPLAPTTLTTDPPSNIPAEADVTTAGYSFVITQPHASLPSSANSSSSSKDRQFSLPVTELPPTSLSSPTSSEISFTERRESTVPFVTSSTEAIISTTNILSARGNSAPSAGSASPTSTSSATTDGSSAASLPSTTGITSTIWTTVLSSSTASSYLVSITSTPATASSQSTHVTGTFYTVSSSTYSTKTPHTYTSRHPKMTTPALSSSTALPWPEPPSTSVWTVLPSLSTTWLVTSRRSTSFELSRTWTDSVLHSSSPATFSRTTSEIFTATSANTTPVIVSTPTSENGISSTTSTTDSLRTDSSNVSAFARNTGAIVGVSLAATIALICLVLFLFFTCRRYRRPRPRIYSGSTDNIITLAREVAWRRSVDGDDDSYIEKPRYFPSPGSPAQSVDDTLDAFGFTSAGEHPSNGHGSAESGSATIVTPINTLFGGQPPMPGLDHEIQSAAALPPVTTTAAFLSKPHTNPQGHSNPYRHTHTGGTRSATSLALTRESSSTREGTGFSSATEETSGSPHGKHISKPRPLGLKTNRRHSSTPPTAFMGTRQRIFDHERQTLAPEQSDRLSVKSFISRLRNGRRTSIQSVSTVRGPSYSQNREPDSPGHSPSVSVFSPSLLNPPVTIIAPQPVLTFPRGVTGNSYIQSESQMAEGPHETGHLSDLWPPATLPPSPSPTYNSSLAEGLLHPRLSLTHGQSHQASMTSLRDHEDYTRPINGLVNNHLRSTTTFDTQDTTESVGPPLSNYQLNP